MAAVETKAPRPAHVQWLCHVWEECHAIRLGSARASSALPVCFTLAGLQPGRLACSPQAHNLLSALRAAVLSLTICSLPANARTLHHPSKTIGAEYEPDSTPPPCCIKLDQSSSLTVTLLARLRGWSTSKPRSTAASGR